MMANARGERRPTHKHAWHEKKACRMGRPLHYDENDCGLPSAYSVVC
jgi:hypothetical protein